MIRTVPPSERSTLISPLRLFTPARLDLVCKLLFFESLISGTDLEAAESLYRRHILGRTGGIEPPDFLHRPSHKTSIVDYVAACHELLHAMRTRGYDERFPVPVNGAHALLNGSHRAACAAALGLSITVEQHDYAAGRWDFQWLRDNGSTTEDFCRVLGRYFDLFPAESAVCVLWGPALRYWDQLAASIGPHFEAVGHFDIGFSQREAEAFASLVYDIYALETDGAVDDLPNITRKIELLAKAPTFLRVMLLRHTGSDDDRAAHVKETKTRLRDVAHPDVPAGDFITCHISDGPEESAYLADVLLNLRNIEHVRLRIQRSPRRELQDWILACRRKIAATGLRRADVCVVGSGVLEATGIRNATDLDFTVTSAMRRAHYGPTAENIGDRLDVVTEGYHRREGQRLTDDELITQRGNFFVCRGLKFARLDIVRDRKAFSRRDKDLIDVDLIDRTIGALGQPSFERRAKEPAPDRHSGRRPVDTAGFGEAGARSHPPSRQASRAIRIAVTCDIFRNHDAGLDPVAQNGRWLHAVLRQINWDIPVQVTLHLGKSDGGDVDTAAIYQRLGFPQSPAGWARMVTAPSLGDAPELDVFRDADIVVGFGLTPAMLHMLDAFGTRTLDVELSPLRFGRRRYLRARTNCPVLARAIRAIAVTDDEIAEEAQLLAARHALASRPAGARRSIGVVFGQSDVDLALVADGRIVSLQDDPVFNRLLDLAQTVDELHLVPHPNVQRNPANLQRLIAVIPNATLEAQPAYSYMTSADTCFAAALSSSTLDEAARFGITTHRLATPDRDRPEALPGTLGPWVDVHDGLISSAFWRAIMREAPVAQGDARAHRPGLVDAILGHGDRTGAIGELSPLPHFAVSQRYALGANGPGVAALRYGWHEPEGWGAWSKGHYASLSFHGDPNAWRHADLELDVFGPDPGHPPDILVRSTAAAAFAPAQYLTTDAGAVLRCARETAPAGSMFNITFLIPSPRAPAQFGMTDTRLLGVGVKALTLRP
jgi:hypothetical protein